MTAKDHRVRVVAIDGNPWFVAADVCRALDLRGYPSQHTAKLSETNKRVLSHAANTRLPIFNKKQYTATVVTESGLYDLVFLPHKPDAEEFKTWVTRDVLPAIRKDGMYVQGEEKIDLTDDDALDRMTELVLEEGAP